MSADSDPRPGARRRARSPSSQMKPKHRQNRGRTRLVFLFDVDNTLLDNDRVIADLERHLRHEVGSRPAQRYWAIFEELRSELGYADYLGALQRYRTEHPREMRLLAVSRFLIEYPFHRRLFPRVPDVIDRVRRWGTAVLLTDGDVVFQPRKVDRSGLGKVVGGRTLIYVHKEQALDDVAARFPADHYVLVDDKLRLLAAVKESWGARVTTVFVRQGHYALDRTNIARYPAADLSLDRIGDLLDHGRREFAPEAGRHQPTRDARRIRT